MESTGVLGNLRAFVTEVSQCFDWRTVHGALWWGHAKQRAVVGEIDGGLPASDFRTAA
jgi:hypothetical protein